MQIDPRLLAVVRQQPYPLIFVTISGSHLYGFPSADSDYDLRGLHLLPLEEVVGLETGRETIEQTGFHEGLEIELVSHEAKKFFTLLLKKNGYVLEQIFSPWVVHSTPVHDELKAIARDCITRHHAFHYLGFAENQWRLFERKTLRVKQLLYIYRILLTGIHLMRTGEIEANLPRLNEAMKLPYVAELIEFKQSAGEKAILPEVDLAFHESEYARLRGVLEIAQEQSSLPEEPAGKQALNDLLLRLRLTRTEKASGV